MIYELTLVFDVGVAKPGVARRRADLELRWVDSAALTELDLDPPGLGEGMLSGRFDLGDRWLPYQGPAVR